jgi:hypothetical protein
MIRIERPLPGEMEGNIDPEDYGFAVIKEEPPSNDEVIERVGRLYAQAKERTGVVIPELEPCLAAVSGQSSGDEGRVTNNEAGGSTD